MRAVLALPVLEQDVAGIDVGATEIYVAVPTDRDEEPVRSFGSFTEDLRAIAGWLQQCGIRKVAMESTGVYWIGLMQVLSDAKLEVWLVNARHYKNVPGKKTDVMDCQWLQFLASVGLLRNSHRPEQAICGVRTLLRMRSELIAMAAQHIQHMQKCLEQMNIKLAHVISELAGVTGLAIVEAIAGGERDPEKLTKLRDKRIQASAETIRKSLEGDYREEHVITLGISLALYRQYQEAIESLDKRMEEFLYRLPEKIDTGKFPLPATKKKNRKKTRHAPAFDLRTHCYRVLGVDLTEIPSIDELTAYSLVSEVGRDFSAFRSASAFASWLRLCPKNEISGGTILKTGTGRGKNRLAIALRTAAQTLHGSQTGLGQWFRSMKAKLGPAEAITAAAHKIARIIYHMVTTGDAYDEALLLRQNTARIRERKMARTRRDAKELGFTLIPLQPQQAPRKDR